MPKPEPGTIIPFPKRTPAFRPAWMPILMHAPSLTRNDKAPVRVPRWAAESESNEGAHHYRCIGTIPSGREWLADARQRCTARLAQNPSTGLIRICKKSGEGFLLTDGTIPARPECCA